MKSPTQKRKFLAMVRFTDLGINRIFCVRARSIGQVEQIAQRYVAKTMTAGLKVEITELQEYREIDEPETTTQPST